MLPDSGPIPRGSPSEHQECASYDDHACRAHVGLKRKTQNLACHIASTRLLQACAGHTSPPRDGPTPDVCKGP